MQGLKKRNEKRIKQVKRVKGQKHRQHGDVKKEKEKKKKMMKWRQRDRLADTPSALFPENVCSGMKTIVCVF